MLALLLGCSLLGVPGCGLIFGHRADPKSPGDSETMVEVENHHWNDVVVYLMNGNQPQRLGLVNGVSTNRFVFPYRQIATGGRLRLRAHPVGGQGSFTSEDVVIQPGQSIRWTLESDLRRSSLAVF